MKSILCVTLALASVALGAGEIKSAPTPAMSTGAAHQSVLDGYRRYEEAPAITWRQANEGAAALGGHLGQIRGKPSPPPPERSVPHDGNCGAHR